MSELKPGWIERQLENVEIELSIMPTCLLPPEMQEQRKKMTKAEIIKAVIVFYIKNYAEKKEDQDLTEFDREVIFTLIPLLNKYVQKELSEAIPQ